MLVSRMLRLTSSSALALTVGAAAVATAVAPRPLRTVRREGLHELRLREEFTFFDIETSLSIGLLPRLEVLPPLASTGRGLEVAGKLYADTVMCASGTDPPPSDWSILRFRNEEDQRWQGSDKAGGNRQPAAAGERDLLRQVARRVLSGVLQRRIDLEDDHAVGADLGHDLADLGPERCESIGVDRTRGVDDDGTVLMPSERIEGR